ncbi:MAG: UDP-N-acetylmuramyl-tripeptide synthetase [Candidatus Dojkabacteria bacterium]|nr:UDP-N-acetylmuramyl-tripeptide synthetase [Candidatus Dojkabacteria bacterium]
MGLSNFVPQPIKNQIHKWQALWANIRFGFPSSGLKIIGVTGTDGKTSTSIMIYNILKKAGYKVGLISTISAKIGNVEMDTGFHVTTPDPWEVPKFLDLMVKKGMEWVVFEVTSHALDQNRVAYIEFEKAVFTNITDEHLDYHKTWKKVALAKTKLIDQVKEGGDIIYKEDERGGKFIARMIRANEKVFVREICSDDSVKDTEVTREGLKFKYMINGREEEISIPILGEYNISNAQCAIKTCQSLVKNSDIVEALSEFRTPLGRMHIVRRRKPCLVIVDFAHTPNAMKKALQTASTLKGKGNLLVVFGSAGLRDRMKRAKMGKSAGLFADIIIITAEDPRTEDLSKINDEILEGTLSKKRILVKRFKTRKDFRNSKISALRKILRGNLEEGRKPVFAFDQNKPKSREDAIELALKVAEPEDIVIITGKAHEKSLCFGTTEYPWSDFDAVKRAVKTLKNQSTNSEAADSK